MKLPALLSPLLLILLLVASPAAQGRQSGEIDILLKGGHVIDPANGIDRVMDVAIAGDRIVEVAPNISSRNARRVIDVSGLYVTPGLIDLHTHVYFGTTDKLQADS